MAEQEFGKVEVEPCDSRFVVVRILFENADYMQIQSVANGEFGDLTWATQLGPVEALTSIVDREPLHEGFVVGKDDDEEFDLDSEDSDSAGVAIADVLDHVARLPGKVDFFRVYDKEMDFGWLSPRKMWTGSDVMTAEMRALVRPHNLQRIIPILAATAMPNVKKVHEDVLHEFAEFTPLLQQA